MAEGGLPGATDTSHPRLSDRHGDGGHPLKTSPPYAFEYRPGLDAVRGIAILLVLAAHAGVPGFAPDGGPAGVTLFFVLSGFLITPLLLVELNQAGSVRMSAFYWRRALRLLLALAAVLVVVTVSHGLGGLAELRRQPSRGRGRHRLLRRELGADRRRPVWRARPHVVAGHRGAVLPRLALAVRPRGASMGSAGDGARRDRPCGPRRSVADVAPHGRSGGAGVRGNGHARGCAPARMCHRPGATAPAACGRLGGDRWSRAVIHRVARRRPRTCRVATDCDRVLVPGSGRHPERAQLAPTGRRRAYLLRVVPLALPVHVHHPADPGCPWAFVRDRAGVLPLDRDALPEAPIQTPYRRDAEPGRRGGPSQPVVRGRSRRWRLSHGGREPKGRRYRRWTSIRECGPGSRRRRPRRRRSSRSGPS